jgi:hypothetical protein
VEVHVNKLGSMQVDNRQGDIQIYIPDKTGFQVDARARNGEVQSDFGDIKIASGDDQAVATGTVGGGGPHLVLNNEHGTIEIRKASSAPEAPVISGEPAPKTPKSSHSPPSPKVPQPTMN